MKKWYLTFMALVLAGAIVGCSNFSYQHPIGIPTVSLSLGNRSLTQDAYTGNWILSFTVNAYTLPGSPGGVINAFHLSSGSTLTAGLRVENCEPVTATDCGPFAVDYNIEFASLPPADSYVITAYTVVGQNGSVYTERLPEPIVIR